MKFFDFLLNLLFPRRCLSCGKFGNYICDSCVSMIQYIDTNICPVCQRPAIDGKTHPRCKTRYSLDGVTSFFSYQGIIRKAIKTIKYKPFAFDISETLISLALKKVREDNLFSFFRKIVKERPVFVPTPLHPSRARLRGFNQTEVLGKMLAKHWSLSFVNGLLLRKKPTKPQFKLKKEEREENVKGAFEVSPNCPILRSESIGSEKDASLEITNYRNVILFDDVWTTGATMRTCANVLKRAGAEFVWGLTMAR